jgi:hypothetical protein
MSGRHALSSKVPALIVAFACACADDPGDPGLDGSRQALASIIATLSAGTSGLQVKRRAEAFWEPAGIGTPFLPGDWVQTGADADARIQFVRGGRVDLDPSSIVVIDEGLLEGGGEALLSVEAGVVRGVLREPTQTLGIRAPDGGVARLRPKAGSGPVEYRLSKRARGTEVAIRRGEATLSSPTTTREVRAGEAAEVSRHAVGPVVTLPPPPPLSSPAAGASVVVPEGESVRLEWGSLPQAAGYRLQVSRGDDFKELAGALDTQLSQEGFQPSGEGTLHWRVASFDRDGRMGDFGPSRTVHVYLPVVEDALIVPEDGTRFLLPKGSARVAFRWAARQGASYRLVIARGAQLDGPPVLDELLAEAAATLALAPGEYAWGVYAIESDGGARPLFGHAWVFAIARSGPGVSVPRAIREWGE